MQIEDWFKAALGECIETLNCDEAVAAWLKSQACRLWGLVSPQVEDVWPCEASGIQGGLAIRVGKSLVEAGGSLDISVMVERGGFTNPQPTTIHSGGPFAAHSDTSFDETHAYSGRSAGPCPIGESLYVTIR